MVKFSKLSGNVAAVCSISQIVLIFWEEDRSVVILGSLFGCIDLVDGYLIAMTHGQWSESISVVLISSLRNTRLRAATPKLILSDILYASCPIPNLPQPIITGASLSVCTFHWMAEAERKRKGITITTLLSVLGEQPSHFYPVMDSFRLETAADLSKSEAVLPSDSLPCLRHIGHIKSTALTRQSNFRSAASQSSQAGSITIVTNFNGAFVRCLATVSREEEMVFRPLNVPNEADVHVEFYSGALYFQTEDRESVVIQYFD
ncbi:hypothetical protein DFH11DRAFT_308504 [Phellopilus nigrolimitatus]|nr:hypothetical protein DFH11DRAFT_308504 [Phellopilus nigrolimitatus]